MEMQTRDKSGSINSLFGKTKSVATLTKITKLISVYNYLDMSLIGIFSTVDCSKQFKIGKDTLKKYINSGLPYKGKLFTRTKIFIIKS